MLKFLFRICLVLMVVLIHQTAFTQSNKETIIEITTDFGVMKARLYNNTPLHKENFIKLVKQGFYDSLLFHRVINGFMIQGGDPTSKNADSAAMLGSGEAPNLPTIPAEFNKNLIHKKGALAAARDNNPDKKSSNCQFYIVHGKKIDTTQLNPANNYTKDQKEIYQRMGGTPFLDQNYTVFGEVFAGMDIIDKIAATPVGAMDKPKQNVRMKIKIIN
ncbi:MAG: peptidylprolyl isomerase [Chitinophagaceae bacterium]|nr:peptidylprolyl isomerase [Chitinophagaceae bacterium]